MKYIRDNRHILSGMFLFIMFIFLSFNLICSESGIQQNVMTIDEFALDAEEITSMLKNSEHISKK